MLIEDRFRLAEHQYAAQIIRPDKREADRAALEKENAELKDTVKALKAELARLRPPAAAAPAPPPAVAQAPVRPTLPAPAVTNALPRVGDRIRTYRVKRGDTLMKIAAEVYGDSAKWKKIQEANRKALGGTTAVKVGQILVVP